MFFLSYELMRSCWHYHPRSRPTFVQLIDRLLPDVDPHFKEVSFYHTCHDRNHGTQETTIFDEEEDVDDGKDITPSTPLRSPEDVSVPLGISSTSDDDDHDVGIRANRPGRKPWSIRSKNPQQLSCNSNDGSKGISISSSDGSKDSKSSACSANGSIINGRVGMQWPSSKGLEC